MGPRKAQRHWQQLAMQRRLLVFRLLRLLQTRCLQVSGDPFYLLSGKRRLLNNKLPLLTRLQ